MQRRTTPWGGLWGLAVGVALQLVTAPALANDVSVAEDLQVPILLKLLTYDRTITSNPPELLNLGVVYAPHDAASRANRDKILRTLRDSQDKTISGIPFAVHTIAFRSQLEFLQQIADHSIDVVYVTAGNQENLESIGAATAAASILSLTGSAGFVDRGVSVGLELHHNRPQLVVNLDSLRAERHELRANVLKLCRIVGGRP